MKHIQAHEQAHKVEGDKGIDEIVLHGIPAEGL